ncbi:MAG: hypothetical protein D3904_15670 [Candidatus Electrothrix sp. EH2]|nr:hypothetical protein [Candidatus Electrothrix sp. EH2]
MKNWGGTGLRHFLCCPFIMLAVSCREKSDKLLFLSLLLNIFYNGVCVMMNKQRTKQDRINELRSKIYYAESAREAYKAINQNLYQTNSFYAEALKRKLKDLEKA